MMAAEELGRDALEIVEAELRRLGYGGDLRPALITYLCMTTRLLAMRHGAMPAHLLLLGPESTDESYTLQSVLRLLPAESYLMADSPWAVINGKDEIQQRVVVLRKAVSLDASRPTSSAIRALMVDHSLRYKTVVRQPGTGEFGVREINKPGPVVLVTATTRPVSQRLGSRVFTLPVPEDAKRTESILALQADLDMVGPTGPDEALIAFQAYLQRQAPFDVLVPYLRELAAAVGRAATTTRILRDWQRLVALIKAVTVLRHARRERNDEGRYVATMDDYATVYRLVRPLYEAHGVWLLSPDDITG